MEGRDDADEGDYLGGGVYLCDEVAKTREGEAEEGGGDGEEGRLRGGGPSERERREGFAGSLQEVFDDAVSRVEGVGDVEMGEVEEGESARRDQVDDGGEGERKFDPKVFEICGRTNSGALEK